MNSDITFPKHLWDTVTTLPITQFSTRSHPEGFVIRSPKKKRNMNTIPTGSTLARTPVKPTKEEFIFVIDNNPLDIVTDPSHRMQENLDTFDLQDSDFGKLTPITSQDSFLKALKFTHDITL